MADSVVDVYLESSAVRWEHARVCELAGREAICELFWFDVGVVCDPGHDLPESAAVGADVSLVFEVDGAPVRHVRGIIQILRNELDTPGGPTAYRVRIVPRFFKLALVHTQEVWIDRSIPEIITEKLENFGFGNADFELRLTATYPTRDFVVQYKETDLAFVSRLAEQAGICFFLEQDAGSDKLVFADHNAGFRAAPDAEEVPYRPDGEALDVFALAFEENLLSSVYFLRDYNFRTPFTDLTAEVPIEGG